MSQSVPSVGDVIVYHPTSDEQKEMESHGNFSIALPGIVVAAWGMDTINVKIMTDGNGPDLWKTSIMKGKEPGEWEWKEVYEYRLHSD